MEMPGTPPEVAYVAVAAGDRPLLGPELFDELKTTLGTEEIAGYLQDYAALTGWDARSQQLFHAIGDQADLADDAHCEAVLNWLRAWGCRHLRRVDTDRTADVLRAWWDEWGAELPAPGTGLVDLDAAALAALVGAYEALRTARAVGRAVGTRDVVVVLGDTAAAKALFALRPTVFVPWDDPVRHAFGWWGGGPAYAELLGLAASTLSELAERLGVTVDGLPDLLGRPQSTPPKLLDEFLWVRVTKSL
jgi:hypothetical protein